MGWNGLIDAEDFWLVREEFASVVSVPAARDVGGAPGKG
jgi:hypothetical protein